MDFIPLCKTTMFSTAFVLPLLCLWVQQASAGDLNRASIIFHEETPEVFYCPQEKPISLEGMIVKVRKQSLLHPKMNNDRNSRS